MAWVNIKLDFPLSRQICQSTHKWKYLSFALNSFLYELLPGYHTTGNSCATSEKQKLLRFSAESKVWSLTSPVHIPWMHIARCIDTGFSLQSKGQNQTKTFLESRFCGPVSAISHTWCWFYWLLLMPTVAHLTQVIDYHLMSIKFCTLLTFLYIGEIF